MRMASRRSHAPTNGKQIEYELRVPLRGTKGEVMLIAQLRSFGTCSGFLMVRGCVKTKKIVRKGKS